MAPLIPTADDLAHEAAAGYADDVALRQRILMERLVIRKACTDLLAAGFVLRVHDGEAWGCGRTTDLAVVMSNIMASDEERIYVLVKDEASSTGYARKGQLLLIYGNDGYDVIADNSTCIEEHLAGATALADQLADGTYTP